MMTAEQLTLDAAGEVTVAPRRRTVREKYQAWLNTNPTGLAEVAAVTRAMSAHNGRAPTIAQVFDELRTRRITAGPELHWDNTLRAPVARGVMRRYPDLAGTFPTRRSKVDP